MMQGSVASPAGLPEKCGRRAYTKPVLTEFGSVKQLTRGGSGDRCDGNSDNGGGNNGVGVGNQNCW